MTTEQTIKESLRMKRYYQDHKAERIAYGKQYYQDHKAEVVAKEKLYRNKNSSKIAARRRKYRALRKSIDPNFRIIKSIKNGMTKAIKHNAKAGHTIELLGCSIEYFRAHLENQFTEGMTWDNYGYRGWHIDHIIPLSYFDHNDPEQQKRAWHYTNLQPLWARDNIRKSNKIEERQLVLL
jgi:5-methylcytosine-specific restriction endonuclease McrA